MGNKLFIVALAKDVLARISAGEYEPESGTWFTWDYGFDRFYYGDQLQDKLKAANLVENPCQVCGIGALFTSLIFEKNACTMGDAKDSRTIYARLDEVMGVDQVNLIEFVFEQGQIGRAWDNGIYVIDEDSGELDSTGTAAMAFADRHEGDSGRMIAIMQNIVANGGEFRP